MKVEVMTPKTRGYGGEITGGVYQIRLRRPGNVKVAKPKMRMETGEQQGIRLFLLSLLRRRAACKPLLISKATIRVRQMARIF
ncbi:hypothetical protein DXU84_25265 [Rahnella sp. RcJ3]|nr:hypothetical protein [Rahnella sp. RcJ3]